jgi:O-antigen/teichoic acid export membrane protein
MASGSLTRRVAYNSAVQLAGKAAVIGLGAISIVVVTRYLGTAGYGQYSLALTYIQLFGVLADAGIYTIVVRELAKRPQDTGKLVGNALALRLLLALVVVPAAVLTSPCPTPSACGSRS